MHNSFFKKITFHSFDELDSTNKYANQLLRQNIASNGDVIIANYQTNGKGQADNVWFSEKNKNILLSLVCKDININISMLSYANMLVSLALHDTINVYFKNEFIKIKWPNDIYVNDKKIAGILIESNISGDITKNMIIGIGLNINATAFPENLLDACSFFTLSKKEYNIDEVTMVLLDFVSKRIEDLNKREKLKIIEEYNSKLYGIDIMKYFRSKGQRFCGIIRGINTNGQLIVEANGSILEFNNKEIEFERSSN